jgi:hypothetical protein
MGSRGNGARVALVAVLLPLLVVLAGCGGNSRKREPTAEKEKSAASTGVKITHFYAGSPVVRRGEEVSLCYGVERAKALRLEPAVAEIWPSRNHCVQIRPTEPREYKLIATGEDGKEVAQTVSIRIGASAEPSRSDVPESLAPSMISAFATSRATVPAGELTTICYSVQGAKQFTVRPSLGPVDPSGKGCFTVKASTTTTYTLEAVSPSGERERQTVTIRVP